MKPIHSSLSPQYHQKWHDDIKLKLDYPGLPYRPGDMITGSLSVPQGHNISYIGVRLEGRLWQSDPNLVGNQKQRDNLIVSRTIEVMKPPRSSGSWDWRFSIPIPHVVDPPSPFDNHGDVSSRSTSQHARGLFATDPDYPLPPTLLRITPDSQPYPMPSLGPSGGQSAASITYTLVPTVAKHIGRAEPVKIVHEQVRFWMTGNCPPTSTLGSPTPQKSTETFRVSSTYLTPGGGGFKDSSGSILDFACQVMFTAPTYAHIGDAIEAAIDLNLVGAAGIKLRASDIPISLESWRLSLDRIWYSNVAQFESHENVSILKRELIRPLKGPYVFKPDKDRDETAYLGIKGSCHRTLLTQGAVTDFKTPDLSVYHRLSIQATFKCCGVTKVCHTKLPFRVLARDRRRSDQGEFPGFVEGPQEINEDWGLPPGYEMEDPRRSRLGGYNGGAVAGSLVSFAIGAAGGGGA